MATLQDVFRDVRVELSIPEPKKPLIYDGKSGPVKAWNSGGRSLIFEQDGQIHRVKGVDPGGLLTVKAGNSSNNTVTDVESAINYVASGIYTPTGEPFGTITGEKAYMEGRAIELLTEECAKYGVKYPCIFEETVSVSGNRQMQNWFTLRRKEDDLRVHELDQYIVRKMKNFNSEELQDRCKDILKLYGRFNIWAGMDMHTLLACKLKPSANSFLPQNYVIAKVGDGYGVFRVDHTSTAHLPDATDAQIYDSIQKEHTKGSAGLEQSIMLRLPTAVLLAIEPKQAVDQRNLEREIRKHGSLLAGAYNYMGTVQSDPRSYPYFLNVLINAYAGGVKFGLSNPNIIGKEWFDKVLKD